MKATNPIYIFEIGDDNVTDWIAARSLEDAAAGYVEMYGPEQLEDARAAGQSFRVLSPKELDKFTYRDDEQKPKSFAERLREMVDAGEKFPTHFACTEF